MHRDLLDASSQGQAGLLEDLQTHKHLRDHLPTVLSTSEMLLIWQSLKDYIPIFFDLICLSQYKFGVASICLTFFFVLIRIFDTIMHTLFGKVFEAVSEEGGVDICKPSPV